MAFVVQQSALVRVQHGLPLFEQPHYEILYWTNAGGVGPAHGAAYLWFSPDNDGLVDIDTAAGAIVQLLEDADSGGPTGNGVTAYQAVKYELTETGGQVVK